MNIRVLENVEGVGRVSDSAVLRGLKYLSGFERESGKNLVRVVSLSFGKYQKGKALGLYIEHLAHVRDGILVLAAAGNEDTQKPIFPAAHRSVISVTGLSASGKKATYSNYGSWVNIAAPGGEVREGREYAIESSIPGGGFASIQGTSMATPIVAGVAGLILTLNPEISLKELRNTLLQSSDPQIYDENFAEGYNFRNYYPKIDKRRVQLLGVGMLDASAAVRGVKAQQNDVKNNKRVQIQCATTVQTDAGQMDLRLFLFLLPVFCVLSLCWFEKKRA